MKQKIKFIAALALALAILLSITLFCTVFATPEINVPTEEEPTPAERSQSEPAETEPTFSCVRSEPDSASSQSSETIRIDAPKEKSISLKGSSHTLSYQKSAYGWDEYQDSEEVTYYFDQNENFTGYFDLSAGRRAARNADQGSLPELDEAAAIKIATQEARTLFADKFTPLSVVQTNQSSSGEWSISFLQPLGEEGFILGYECSVHIMPDGGVMSCRMYRYEELKKFDSSLLNGITKEAVHAQIESQIAALYGDLPELEYTISDATLNHSDDGYYAVLLVTGTYLDEDLTAQYGREARMSIGTERFVISLG